VRVIKGCCLAIVGSRRSAKRKKLWSVPANEGMGQEPCEDQ
jgi:hypothetical protein